MPPLRILVADDHPVVLAGVCSLLESTPDFEVTARVVNGARVVPTALEVRPDVVVLDLYMPGLSPVDAVRTLRGALPDTRILVLSGWGSKQDQQVLFSAGAHAFVSKNAEVEELPRAIRELFPQITAAPPPPRAPSSILKNLSAREQEICAQVARGLSNREIAGVIGIGEETVRRHVTKILGKLGLARRTQLALIAVREGYGSLDDVPQTPSRRRPRGDGHERGGSTDPEPNA